MDDGTQNDSSRSKLPRVAITGGLVAFFLTSGVVSGFTPDGNLVVALVPAFAAGLAVFGLVLWGVGRRE
jgi:hypothetical protein